MHNKKSVFTNPCSESWANMNGDDRQRMCSICKEYVHDLTELPPEDILQDFVDSEKCVKMDSDQTAYFKFLRSLPKVAGLSAALTLLPFANLHAQDQSAEKNYCVVYGKVKSNIVSNRNIFVVVNGHTIKTRSNEIGDFRILIPKGAKIQYSNIRKLDHKTLENDSLNIKKIRLPKVSTFIGTPSF